MLKNVRMFIDLSMSLFLKMGKYVRCLRMKDVYDEFFFSVYFGYKIKVFMNCIFIIFDEMMKLIEGYMFVSLYRFST